MVWEPQHRAMLNVVDQDNRVGSKKRNEGKRKRHHPGQRGRDEIDNGCQHRRDRRPSESRHPMGHEQSREAEPQKDRLTLSVPEAGQRYFGLSRNGAYAAAARGDIPTIRIGRLLRVPVRAMELRLDAAASSNNGANVTVAS